MNIPLLDHPIQEKLVTIANVSWEEFKGIEAQLKDNRNRNIRNYVAHW
ncbi:MAG: hypothetical protein V7K38_12785 [Nostoc sp.]